MGDPPTLFEGSWDQGVWRRGREGSFLLYGGRYRSPCAPRTPCVGLLSLLHPEPVSVNSKVLSPWRQTVGVPSTPRMPSPHGGATGAPPYPCVQPLSAVWLCHPLLSRTVTVVPVALRCWDGCPRFPTPPGLNPSSAGRTPPLLAGELGTGQRLPVKALRWRRLGSGPAEGEQLGSAGLAPERWPGTAAKGSVRDRRAGRGLPFPSYPSR